MKIDLNCDVGESFGVYHLGNDEALMTLITSANIACGAHAGDPQVMDHTVRLAARHGVSIGAHPGFPDLEGFGRRAMQLTPKEVEHTVLYQVGALSAFVRSAGAKLTHVKPHGALYNMAVKDVGIARAIVRGIACAGKGLIVVGLARSALVEAAQQAGLRVAREGFADRAYEADGSLRSRKLDGAVLIDPEVAAEQAVSVARDGFVTARTGVKIAMPVDTICVHGDTPSAIALVIEIRRQLEEAGVEVAPMDDFVG
jgi:UPF0271 protein